MAEWPDYYVTEFFYHQTETDSTLSVMVNGRCFRIHLWAEHFEGCPTLQEKYLHYLEIARGDDPDDEDAETVEDMYDWVLEPLLPLLNQVPPLDTSRRYTLEDYLFPETFNYTLRAVNGKLVSSPYEPDRARARPCGVRLPNRTDYSMFPSFRPHEVEIIASSRGGLLSAPPRKVLIHGDTLCYFKRTDPGTERSIVQELRTYTQIQKADLGEDARISRLHGLVQEESGGLVLGFLLSYIDCRNLTLECAVTSDVPLSQRQQWIDQVTYTLDRLHESGIVWGDVKAGNVLVDTNGDAWVTDFGGGYTRGWVERDQAGTEEGDLQGLEKIKAYLFV